MRRLNVLLILALLTFGRLEILSAQQARHAPWLDLWFLQARFSESDQNKDQQLSYSEMEAFPEEWAYFLIDDFFVEADLNEDGFLNEQETWRRIGSAHHYRVKLDAALVADLREKYPYFDDAKLVYFKRHPELTAELLKNLSWLRIHPDIPYKLLANPAWWKDNPEVLQALNRNLTGLAEHPSIALRFFTLPVLTRYVGFDRGFKAGYKNIFAERKREQSYAYRISFYDEDIPAHQIEGTAVAARDAEGKTTIDPQLPASAAGLQAEADQLEAELLTLIQRLQKENEILKTAENTLQEQIDALNEALSEAAQRPDKNALLLLQRKVAELTSAKSRLETELNQAVFAQRETRVDDSNQLAQIEELKGEVVRLEEENGRLQRIMRSNNTDLRDANIAQESQIRQLQNVITQMGNQLDQVSSNDNSAEITRYQGRIQALQNSLKTAQQDLEHVKSSWTETAQTLTEVNQERRQLRLALQNLEAQQMVKNEQLNQRLENNQIDQAQYESLLAENQKQKLEINQLNASVNNLETSLLSKSSSDEGKIRQELETKYIANIQAQITRSDSISRLNQELAKQVDELQYQFVQMEMKQANSSESTEASLERLEQHYKAQTQKLNSEIAGLKQENQQLAQKASAAGNIDPNLIAEKDALSSENEKMKIQMARQTEAMQTVQMEYGQSQKQINALSQQVQSLTVERDLALADNGNQTANSQDASLLEAAEALQAENLSLRKELANQKQAVSQAQMELSIIENSNIEQQLQEVSLVRDSALAENNRLLRMNRLQEEQIASMQSQLSADNRRSKDIAEEREQEYRNRIIKLEGQLETQTIQKLAVSEELETLKAQDKSMSLDQQAQLLEIKRLQAAQDSLMKENFVLLSQNETQAAQLANMSSEQLDAQNQLNTKMVAEQQAQSLEIKRLKAAQDSMMDVNLALASQNEMQAAQISSLDSEQVDAQNQLNTKMVAEQQAQLLEIKRMQAAQDSLMDANLALESQNKMQAAQISSLDSEQVDAQNQLKTKMVAEQQAYLLEIKGLKAVQDSMRDANLSLASQNEMQAAQIASLDSEQTDAQSQLQNKMVAEQQAYLLEIKRMQAIQDSLIEENFALASQNDMQVTQLANMDSEQVDVQNQLKTKMVLEQQEAAKRINQLEGSLESSATMIEQLKVEQETNKLKIDEFAKNQATLLQENDRLTLALENQSQKMRTLEQNLSNAEAEKASFASTRQSESTQIDTIEKQLMVLRMENELGREVEDSLMARSQRQLLAIRTLKQERDTLVKSIRDRDRVIESYATRMHLQKDSLAQLLTMQNRAYSEMNSQKSNGLERIDKLHQQIQSLEYENEKLLVRIDENLKGEDQLKLQVAKLEAHNVALEAKNKSLQAKKRRKDGEATETTSLAVQLESLETEKRNLAIEKASLQEQLFSLETFIGQIRQSETQLKREVQVQKALNSQLDNQVDSLEQEIEEFHSYNWPDSVDYYRNQLLYARASTENQRGMAIASDLNNQRQKDSLRQEIIRIEESFAKRESNNKIDQARIRAIELQEAELEQDRKKLAKQEQIIRQQSRMIEDRLKALSDLEERYLDVLEREKELQMIEQSLKQQPGYKEAKKDWRRNGSE